MPKAPPDLVPTLSLASFSIICLLKHLLHWFICVSQTHLACSLCRAFVLATPLPGLFLP